MQVSGPSGSATVLSADRIFVCFRFTAADCVFVCVQVKLERILGLTVTSNAALACDPNTGTIAYPAG